MARRRCRRSAAAARLDSATDDRQLQEILESGRGSASDLRAASADIRSMTAAVSGTQGSVVRTIVATDSLLTFVVAPWWGRLSDRIGRRPVLLVGLAGSVVSYLVFGLAASLAVLFLSRIISGATGATIHVAQAYLADVTPAERRSHAMGMIGAAFGLGFTVGPAIGGIASKFGDPLPGLIAAAIAAVNLVLAWSWLPETDVRRRPDYRPLPLRETGLGLPAGIMFASTLAFTAIYVSFPLFAQEILGYERPAISGFFVVIGVVTIVVQGRLVGRLAPRVGERRLVLLGSLIMAAGFGLFPYASVTTAGLVLCLVALTSGFCLVGPSLAGRVLRRHRLSLGGPGSAQAAVSRTWSCSGVSSSAAPSMARSSWCSLLPPSMGRTPWATSHAKTSWLRVAPVWAATSSSAANRRSVPGWSNTSGMGLSGLS